MLASQRFRITQRFFGSQSKRLFEKKKKTRPDYGKYKIAEQSAFGGFSLQDDPLGISKLLIEEQLQKKGIKKPKFGFSEENMYDIQPLERRLTEELGRLKQEFDNIQIGTPPVKVIESLLVQLDDKIELPIEDIAQITVKSATELTIQSFHILNAPKITKTINSYNKTWKPENMGNGLLRLTLPKLSKGSRNEAIKVAQAVFEKSENILRDLCSDSTSDIRESIKDKSFGVRETKRVKDCEVIFLKLAKQELQKKIQLLSKD